MEAPESHRRTSPAIRRVWRQAALALSASALALTWPLVAPAGNDLADMQLAAVIEQRSDDTNATGSIHRQEPAVIKDELQSNGVRAELKATRMGAPVPAGGTAFATIVLTNESGSQSVAAELVLDAEVSEIKQIIGGVTQDGGDAISRVIAIPKIDKKKPQRVTVELLLKEVTSADAKKTNRLRIMLRQPGAATGADTTELSWRVIDCPGAFYEGLVKIRDANAEAIEDLLKTVQQPDRSRDGRWLFAPSSTSASQQTCLKSERVRDRRGGRSYYRCLEFAPAAAGPDPETLKLEREVVRFATPLVSRRNVDPELSTKRDTGWVSFKVGTDLRGYLSQPKSPAICTGVPAFIGYYQTRLASVSKRIEMFESKAEEAMKVARSRVMHAREVASNSIEGHPGWGGAPLDPSPPAADADLRSLTKAIAAITGSTALQESVATAGSAYDALKAVKEYFDGSGRPAIPNDVASAMRSALAAIEAADYVAAATGPYSAIDRHIVGSLDAIGRAHAEHCACAE